MPDKKLKKHTVGYIRDSQKGVMLNVSGLKKALDGLETYKDNEGVERFRFGFFKQDMKDFLDGKVEYVKIVQLQDE